jgi:hypothetical protein
MNFGVWVLVLGVPACSGNLGLSSGALGGGGTYTSESCIGDPDHPQSCTYWTCLNVPTQYGNKTHCTAPNNNGQPPGSYSCPQSGEPCPGPNAGGSGPWTCSASAGTLTCDRQGGGSGWSCTSANGTTTCTNPDCTMTPAGEFGCIGSSPMPPGSPPGGWNCGLVSGVYTCTSSGGGSGFAGCTYTQGYWKNHPSAWPETSLTIGGTSYSQDELLALFGTSPGGDASLILGHQLIAALLNQANGAGVPPEVAAALSAADAWMAANADADGRLPYGVAASSAAGQQAVGLSETLDQFNSGMAGPPHCG